jgi:hypothetical protein
MPRTFVETTCSKCGGDGQIACIICDYTGWTIDKKTGQCITCGECKGDCFIECPACSGDGKRTKKREVGK